MVDVLSGVVMSVHGEECADSPCVSRAFVVEVVRVERVFGQDGVDVLSVVCYILHLCVAGSLVDLFDYVRVLHIGCVVEVAVVWVVRCGARARVALPFAVDDACLAFVCAHDALECVKFVSVRAWWLLCVAVAWQS